MARRLLAALAAFVLVVGQAGSALARPRPRNGGQRAAGTSAPDRQGPRSPRSTRAPPTGSSSSSRRSRTSAARQDQGPRASAATFVLDDPDRRTPRSHRPRRSPSPRSQGAKATSYWLTNVLVVTRQLEARQGVRQARRRQGRPGAQDLSARQARRDQGRDPRGRRRPRVGRRQDPAPEAWADGIIGQGVVVANVDTGVDFTHPALVNQYRGNIGGGDVRPQLQLVGPDRHLRRRALRQRRPRHPHDGHDGRRRRARPVHARTSASPRAPAGSRPRAARTSAAPRRPCSRPASSSSPRRTWTATTPTRPCARTSSTTRGAADPATRSISQSSRPGARPGSSRSSRPATPARSAAKAARPATSSRSSAPARPTSTTTSPTSRAAARRSTARSIRTSAPRASTSSRAFPAAATSRSPARRWRPRTRSGAIALILSAKPALIGDPNNYVTVTDAVRATAVDRIDDSCGGDEDGDPNNVYGDGRIDAKAAVDLVATGGTLAGTVTDAATATRSPAPRSPRHGGFRDFTVTTDAAGHYEMFLAAGTYDVSAVPSATRPKIAPASTIVTDETTTQNFALEALPRFSITRPRPGRRGRLADRRAPTSSAIGTPVPAARHRRRPAPTRLTLPIGTYTIRGLGRRLHRDRRSSTAWSSSTRTSPSTSASAASSTTSATAAVPIAFSWVDATTQTALYGDDFAGRLHLPFPFDVLRRGVRAGLHLRQRLHQLPRRRRVQRVPAGDPVRGSAECGDLRRSGATCSSPTTARSSTRPSGSAGNRDLRPRVHRHRRPRVDRDRRLRDQALRERRDARHPLRQQPGEPRRRPRARRSGSRTRPAPTPSSSRSRESLVVPNTALPLSSRCRRASSTGTVTDKNDGEPIAGATVTASPGLGSTKTAEDGTYTPAALSRRRTP